ncbi:MAG: AAA family ATPase, partial [Thermoanaerobaculales bacterium]
MKAATFAEVEARAAEVAAARAVQGIVTVTAAELQHREFPPLVEIIEGLVLAGLFLLAGAPKIGKSWLALLLALAKAMGGEALGVRTSAAMVLFVGLEDGMRRLHKRLGMMLPNGDIWPEHLLLADATSWPWRGPQAVDELRRYHDAHPGLKFVVLDTLARLRPPTGGKRGSGYDLDVEFAAPFQALAIERELGVLGCVHTRKQDRKYRELDGLESVSGTLGLPGTADGVLVLQRGRLARQGELLITGRDLPERKLALSFDPACGLWSCIGDAAEVIASQARQA